MEDLTKLSDQELKVELEEINRKVRKAKNAKKSDKKEERVKNLVAQLDALLAEKRRRRAEAQREEV